MTTKVTISLGLFLDMMSLIQKSRVEQTTKSEILYLTERAKEEMSLPVGTYGVPGPQGPAGATGATGPTGPVGFCRHHLD